MALMNFEPFIDFDSLTEEMAADLHKAVRENRAANEAFLDSDEPSIELAIRCLKAVDEVDATYKAIMHSLYTQPVMVHKAGPLKEETNPDNPLQEGIVQRCVRCGSVLNFWTDGMGFLSDEGPRLMKVDDVQWWDEGAIVAKNQDGNSMDMYDIDPSRELQRHERECVSLNDLVGPE